MKRSEERGGVETGQRQQCAQQSEKLQQPTMARRAVLMLFFFLPQCPQGNRYPRSLTEIRISGRVDFTGVMSFIFGNAHSGELMEQAGERCLLE